MIYSLILGLAFQARTMGKTQEAITLQYGNTGRGPGGNCSMRIDFKGYGPEGAAIVESVQVYLYASNDYTNPIVTLLVDSSGGAFTITELPEGRFDILMAKDGFFSSKTADIDLNASVPHVSHSTGLTSTREEHTPDEVLVIFKKGVPALKERDIISEAGGKVLRCFSRRDSTYDYEVKIPNSVTVIEMVDYFNRLCSVKSASPSTYANGHSMGSD
jgi:hypothetical protein